MNKIKTVKEEVLVKSIKLAIQRPFIPDEEVRKMILEQKGNFSERGKTLILCHLKRFKREIYNEIKKEFEFPSE